MPLLHLVILALVQGITEFLPISSSAHLVLVPTLTGWDDQGPLIDIAVHVGTLLAVLLYFRRDVAEMALGLLSLLRRDFNAGARLALHVLVATLPVVAAGAVLHEVGMELFRSVEVIAWATLGFGILLWIADRTGGQRRGVADLSFAGAFAIGLAQVLALIPGTSRSGITMTAGRLLGMRRFAAARFSLLMSIPTILAAGALAGADLYAAGDMALLAAGLAFAAALAAIAAMMRWLKTASFTPFVIYRVILGVGLLAWIYA